MDPNAYVFFATGDWRRPNHSLTLSRRLRVARRFPHRAFDWSLSWLTRTLTRARIAHCAIGYDGAVLDPGINGDVFWPLIPYAEDFPTLASLIVVPLKRAVDLDAHANLQPKPIVPSAVRWVTCGITPAPLDCVQTVSRVLRTGGISVPRRTVSPQALRRWLLSQEFQHEDLE